MRKIFFSLIFLFIVSVPVFGETRWGAPAVEFVPEPRLLKPARETLAVKAGEPVIFEWSYVGDPLSRDYYDLRIYKGYEMIVSTLIFRQRTRQYRISVDPALFEDGQVYTWAVRQVYRHGQKSRRNFTSFKVIKPANLR